jgi:hypothetical protein
MGTDIGHPQEQRIEDCVGGTAGMPVVMSGFEDEVDRIARSPDRATLPREAVDLS